MRHATRPLPAMGAGPKVAEDVDGTAARDRGAEVEALRATAGVEVDAVPSTAARERPRLGAYIRVFAYLAFDSPRRLAVFLRGSPAFGAATTAFEPGITAALDTLGSVACSAALAAWVGLRAAPAQPRIWARHLVRLVADAVGTPASYLANAAARAGLRVTPAQARSWARLVVRLVADASHRLVSSAVGNPGFRAATPFLQPGIEQLAVALAAAAYLATTAGRAGLLAVLAQPRRWARGVLRFLVLAAAAYAVVDAFTGNAVLILIVSVFGVPGLLQLGCALGAVA